MKGFQSVDSDRMKYRHLGKSGLKVSVIGLGGWLTLGRSLDSEATTLLVRSAFESGINFFDTADVYTKGEAEKALGEAITGLRREDLVIATKCYWPMTEGVNDRGLSRKHIFESVEGSLRRLGVDYVDLFQFHRYDAETPVEESVRAMGDLIHQGKVLYWGVSEWTGEQIRDACHIAGKVNVCRPISNQPQYNMLERYIEKEVLPICLDEGMGQVVWSPLAQGVLTGKYEPGAPLPSGSRATDGKVSGFMANYLEEKILKAVSLLSPIAGEAGCSLAQFALAWCLHRPGISSCIVGATSEKQLAENVAAAEVEIRPALFARAEEILDEALRP